MDKLQKTAKVDWNKYSMMHHVDEHGIHNVNIHTKHKDNTPPAHVGEFQFVDDHPSAKGKLFPTLSEVHKDHRRKGLATEAYKYVEEKSGKKVAPSTSQTGDARNLWAAKDRKFGKSEDIQMDKLEKGIKGDWSKEGYNISHKEHGNAINVSAHNKDGKEVGSVRVDPHEDDYHSIGSNLSVHKDHQRKGIATAMYQHARKITGKPFHPTEGGDSGRTPDGKKFWANKKVSTGLIKSEDDSSTLIMAYDGDNAGRLVGQSVLANDADGLSEVSGRITHGHDIVHQWVQEHGGKIISGGGDEGTFAIPSTALEDIDQLRSDYEYITKLTMTVGIGTNLSEAGKSLLVGKFRGKNMAVQYDESVEQDLQTAKNNLASGNASPEERKLGEAYLTPDERQSPTESPGVQSETKSEGFADEPAKEDNMASDTTNDLCAETDGDPSNTGGDLCAETDGSEHNHDEDTLCDETCPLCQEDAEQGSDLCAETDGAIPAVDEEQASDLCAETDGVAAVNDAIDGTLPPGETESDAMNGIDDSDMPIGDNFEENVSRPEGFEQNTPGDMGMSEGEDQDSPDLSSVLKDGLDSHADNIQKEKVMEMVTAALEGFKASKGILEKAKEQAPQLYDASIAMLRAMIEMAKMLGLGGSEDAPVQEKPEEDEESAHDPKSDTKQAPQKGASTEEQGSIGTPVGKLSAKHTTKHIARTTMPPGAVNVKGQQKVVDQNGKTRWIDRKGGMVQGPSGVPVKESKGAGNGSKN